MFDVFPQCVLRSDPLMSRSVRLALRCIPPLVTSLLLDRIERDKQLGYVFSRRSIGLRQPTVLCGLRQSAQVDTMPEVGHAVPLIRPAIGSGRLLDEPRSQCPIEIHGVHEELLVGSSLQSFELVVLGMLRAEMELRALEKVDRGSQPPSFDQTLSIEAANLCVV